MFEINIFCGSECPVELIKNLKGYNESQAKLFLNKDMQEIERSGWSLVELSASYGCDFLALIEVEPKLIICTKASSQR